MRLNDTVFDRWREWAGKIKSDLMNIINNEQIFYEFNEVVSANWPHIVENEGPLFCEFVRECFGVHAALGIRRQVKMSEDSISLMKLLYQINQCAKQFTYSFYLKRYPVDPNYFEWQRTTFNHFSRNGIYLSSEIIDSDMQSLITTARKVSDFVDRTMAHMDRRGPLDTLTLNDVKTALELFNRVTCKYLALITGEGFTTLRPTIQFNFKKIFTVPLDMRSS